MSDSTGRPMLSDEELQAVARRWELKSENAKLGAILRRFLSVNDETIHGPARWNVGRWRLFIDGDFWIELTPDEEELVRRVMRA